MSDIGPVVAGTGLQEMSISPDSQLLLYTTRESGGSQVFCTRFPGGDGRWQVSGDGGSLPVWSPDGSSAYYMNTDRELIRVPLTREPTIRFGLPEKVFPIMPKVEDTTPVIPAPDGKRFITVRRKTEGAADVGEKILLIENWSEEFRENRRR